MLTRIAASLFEVLTILGGIGATLLVVSAFLPGQSAVQQAAAAAVAVACVGIPYCMAGAFHRSAMRTMQREALYEPGD